MGSKHATQQGRHFLAILLGSRQAHWLPEAQLQPFQRHCLATCRAAIRLEGVWREGLSLKQRSCQLRRSGGGQSMRSLAGSRLCGLLAAAAKGDLLHGEHAEALAALSAARASAANLRVQCGQVLCLPMGS